MELAFADDSGKDARRSTYLIEAAVCFNETYLPALEARIEWLKEQLEIPSPCELHWHTRTYRQRVGNAVVAERVLTPEEHAWLRAEFLSFLPGSGARVIAVALSHADYSGSLANKVAMSLEWIAERVQMHLQALGASRGSVALGLLLADEPGSAAENRLVVRRLERLHRQGSAYISRFDNLVMNSLLYPSHLVPGIQLADFVAGALDRFLNRREESWWVTLSGNMRRHPEHPNRVLGYGLIVRPELRPLQIGAVVIE